MRGPYTIEIAGETFDPAEFAEVSRYEAEYNATQLQKGARAVAARVARQLGAPVKVFGNIGSGSKKQRVEDSYFSASGRV